ncbi:MAG: alpha/beta hydrolase [Balneolales bacterium]
MTDKNPILLQHGWGYDSGMWDDWIKLNPDIHFTTSDRGYFGKPVRIAEQQAEAAVAHSLGLHLLPEEIFPKLKLLVIVSGFQEFHPNTPIERTFSQRIVRHMLKNVKSDAGPVLKQFHHNSYLPAKMDAESWQEADIDLLHKDLELLDHHKMDIEMLRLAGKIVILHGMKDGIVPHNKAYQLQYSLPQSEIHTVEEGGHMIPVTHKEWCLNHIKATLTQSA